MPTTLTHSLVGLGLAEVFAIHPIPLSFYGLATALSLLPDLDVVSFRLGIPYRSRFGHRGFSHSLCCAAGISVGVAALGSSYFAVPWWLLGGFSLIVVIAHSLLDALTNGGGGIAFFSPFDDGRYFFPWRPVQVSPIGLAVFSRWGLRALLSEIVWIWLPLAVLVGAVVLVRRLR
ncbi:MAG TPA: metal-dependent hydrolase [Gemmataceae bacterium]|nr:metal-dependent hydrolase [Gemmataceae bacterium]